MRPFLPLLGQSRWKLAVLCVVGVLAPAMFGQRVDPPKDLLARDEKFRQALLSRDTEVLATILTEDFIRSPPNSAPETDKLEYMEAIRAAKQRYFAIEVHDAKYRLYGDVVLENATWEVSYGNETRRNSSRTRVLLVWVKQATGWKLASLQGNNAPGK